jgi:aldehyde dehydrogenase (NAD+)/betaine-aldehyde dehydrogenase
MSTALQPDVVVHDRLYIGGEWVTPDDPEATIEVVNPATEQVIGRVPQGTSQDVARAVAAARAAFPGWSQTSWEERARWMERIALSLSARMEEIAAVISQEVGMPIRQSLGIQAGLPTMTFNAIPQLLSEVAWEEEVGNSLIVREAVGVVAGITPWNYPLHQVCAKVAPALAAGCTFVLKPSEVTPLNAFLLAQIIDEIGLPAGVFNLVSGYGPVVGEALASHPDIDMVSFTGSTRAGRRVGELAAHTVKRVALELGGKSPNVILEDADLQQAVTDGVGKCYLNSGQTCSALTRMLVSEAQRRRVRDYIEKGIEEGAKLVTGGAQAPEGLDQGWYVQPTVFSEVTPEMTIAQEEIFGPVLVIMPYEDEEDAVRIANDSAYGLAGGVWSADEERAKRVARRIRTGQVEINGAAFNPLAPFGGYKQSGYGRELGPFGLEEYLQVKSLQL